MLDAVKSGDAKKLAELIRQDPGFNVNLDHGDGFTLLHYACLRGDRSAVIPLLLAHPDINVNAKNIFGGTPFYLACVNGDASCVREMLKDHRVKVNEHNNNGCTPLWKAVRYGYLDVIKWWIASGREMDLGTPGDLNQTDVIGAARKKGKAEVVSLLEKFKENPVETRHAVRIQVGWYDEAAEMFAMVVFVSDGLLQIKATSPTPAARFFNIVSKLPLELQMLLCFRLIGSGKDIIPYKERETAFKILVKKL